LTADLPLAILVAFLAGVLFWITSVPVRAHPAISRRMSSRPSWSGCSSRWKERTG